VPKGAERRGRGAQRSREKGQWCPQGQEKGQGCPQEPREGTVVPTGPREGPGVPTGAESRARGAHRSREKGQGGPVPTAAERRDRGAQSHSGREGDRGAHSGREKGQCWFLDSQQSKGARNRVGTELTYRPASSCSLAGRYYR
jgi:hypothetical protein